MRSNQSSLERWGKLLLLIALVVVFSPTTIADADQIDNISQGAVCDYDGICELGEDLTCFDCSCDADGVCDIGFESNASCPADCYIGDEYCNPYDGEDAVTAPEDCDFCGDGICQFPYGETEENCAIDCAGVPTLTPTIIYPTSTATPTATSTPTSTPTSVPTDVPTEVPPTDAPTALPTLSEAYLELEIPPGCDLVSYEGQSSAWQAAYTDISSAGYLIPQRADDKEVYVCTEPPVGRLCFLLYEDLLTSAGGNVTLIQLVDCSGDSCLELPRIGQIVGEQICFDIQRADGVSCDEGCALVLRETPIEEVNRGISNTLILIIGIGGLVVILTAILLILLLARRRSDEDDEE